MSTLSKTEAALFDLYGTLVDVTIDETSPQLWQRLAAWYNSRLQRRITPESLSETYSDEIQNQVEIHGDGFALENALSEILGPEIRGEEVREFARLFRRNSTTSLVLRHYARPLLETLQTRGIKVGLVSNTEALFTDYDLERLQFKDCFDTVLLSSATGVAKPNPEIILEALVRLETSPSRCVFIGDTLTTDIAAANAANLRRAILISDDIVEPPSDYNVVVVKPYLDDLTAAILA